MPFVHGRLVGGSDYCYYHVFLGTAVNNASSVLLILPVPVSSLMEEVVSAKIDDETRRKMRRLQNINWSEVIRQAIVNKIEEEEARRLLVDREKVKRAAKETDALRTPSVSGWNSTEKIRRRRCL